MSTEHIHDAPTEPQQPSADAVHEASHDTPHHIPGAAADSGPEALMSAASARIAELEAEAKDLRDRWLRSEAEMQNVRTRAKREADDARQYAVQKFARDIVEVAENLRRGLASLPKAAEEDPVVVKLREGFEGVERNLLAILERNGITGADPTGAAFDANLHQAMAEQPSAEHPPGSVMQAWSSAWTLNGRLLKPAMVVVAKAAPAPEGAGATHGAPSADTPVRSHLAGGVDRTA